MKETTGHCPFCRVYMDHTGWVRNGGMVTCWSCAVRPVEYGKAEGNWLDAEMWRQNREHEFEAAR